MTIKPGMINLHPYELLFLWGKIAGGVKLTTS